VSDLGPVQVLREALGEELLAGQVAVVLAPPGVGKSAILVYVALGAMQEDTAVLHVAVDETVDRVRSQYDQVTGPLNLPPAERARLDRQRMIHCHRGGFAVDKLRTHLALLRDAGAFVPGLIVVDGLDDDTVRDAAAGLASLAADLQVPLWVSMRHVSDPIPPEIRAVGTVGLRLTPGEGAVHLSVLRDGTERALDLALTADALLIAASRLGEASRRMRADQVTLYSGGAKGAECLFGELAEQHGLQEVNFTFEGHRANRTVNAVQLSERELEAGNVNMADVSRRLSRTYSTEGTLIRRILQTLWHVVSRAQQVFVVGIIQDDDTVTGGTGWSVELARMWNKDLWVYDCDREGWFRWDGAAWVAGEPVIDAYHVAGTGTRKMTPAAEQALRELFARSFVG
jgi:xanthosine utilization system XapX-like protein